MIIGSVALIILAAVIWLIGLRENTDLWYYGSIVTSALAAFALMVGVRQKARSRIPENDFDVDVLHPAPGTFLLTPRPTGRASVPRQQPAPSDGAQPPPGWPTSSPTWPQVIGPPDGLPDLPPDDENAPDPPDEPPPELISERQARRIATMNGTVVVIDGRPRFHEAGCLHLLGRDVERLPVDEAMQLGFTPCGQCEPARGLLATSPRGPAA